mmetsp:Transcript_19993/g.27417  ORF Transcript_19993/g.27417 Transcript_19993/m.27417 type:complete len:174 (-) Transcript_19993:612-1133(-)|eukprot:CAMPEP_0185727116 /NCGR_PEP_ID=MMETSP1171-20130828/2894_1 /TAXON_ID=374046 /ORGANISM="Helicotheca tamensis, Strain CCMP826" /LENGTH=173 /DNA_ID=CAMNT_0028395619 /DNA_START=75 /DNA_END=596 /DNA_ORIENTATION=-
MDKINQTLSQGFGAISNTFAFIHQHAWSILFAAVVGYYIKVSYLDPYLEERNRQISYRDATNPHRVATLEQDMKRVREMQQEKHAAATSAAAQVEKKKKSEEMEQRRVKQPMEVRGGDGRRLGDGNSSSSSSSRAGNNSSSSGSGGGGYNPMNPWSSSTSGYRPARRNPNRGG